jgi:glycosyltransferase involved in cell wall biosynthesis
MFLSFAERGLARPFLELAQREGFEAHELRTNFPHLGAAVDEVARHLRASSADILLTSGYKPDLIGWRAARLVGIPVVGIAHGWTGVTWKVKLYEWLDALVMRWMDRVVCVSQATALRALQAGIPHSKRVVIPNAVDPKPYETLRPEAREIVEGFFASAPQSIIGAVGRLSPEKGMDVLVHAAALVAKQRPEVGFLVFGDGPARAQLENLIDREGLAGRFVLAGFCADLPSVLPGLDMIVSPSHTEGLPVALLEAMAAARPIIATAVGGTPEVVIDGETGELIPPNNPPRMAQKIIDLLDDTERRTRYGHAGRGRVREKFTFSAMAQAYETLFADLPLRHPSNKEIANVGR